MTRCMLLVVFVLTVPAAIALAQEPAPEPPPKLDLFSSDDPLFVDPAKERELVKRLYAATDDPKAALAAMAELPDPATELELRALRNLDRELSASDDPAHQKLVEQSVYKLALSGEGNSLQYLHKIFDSTPHRRALIADAIARFALAKQRRPHDWPLLVRSLTVVEGDQAMRVLGALAKYRDRGTSPVVVRNVLLAGLELDDDRAAAALKLLALWTGAQPAKPSTKIAQQLAAWQAWYREKYPHLPEAKLPQEDPASPHQQDKLVDYLRSEEGRAGNAANGEKLFEQALCIKCHPFGDRGERIGPDLTKVSQRLTDAELLESLLFPSHQISDQYVTKVIELDDGRLLTGIVSETGDAMIVLGADAKKVTVSRESVESVTPSALSSMPAGTIDKLSPEEVADLFAYLKKVPE